MTPQNTVQIGFQEITAIEVTCSECSGLIRIPLSTRNIPKHLACPGCNRQLWGDGQELAYSRVSGIAKALIAWEEVQAKGFLLGFSLATGKTAQ